MQPGFYAIYLQQEHRNLLFMTELRALFALMLGSKRKYVDPTSSVQILKAAFVNSGGSDNQQVGSNWALTLALVF